MEVLDGQFAERRRCAHNSRRGREGDRGFGVCRTSPRSSLCVPQLIGRADFLFEQSALALAASGRHGDAASLWRNLVGRDVLEGRWTFQIVEGFDDDYYDAARTEVIHLEAVLVGGRRHAHEEQLRERRQAQRSAYLSAETDES